MIERYSRPEMAQVWGDESKFQKWLDVELAACHAHVALGNISESDNTIIQKKATFNLERIAEIEHNVHHDVIAFLTSVAEAIGPESRFVHLGLTSSDVVDTALCLLIQDAGVILHDGIDTMMRILKEQAYTHKDTLMMGRTHGVHAEPLTFGLKLTVWYDEMKRNKQRLADALENCRFGLISGAVGNYSQMSPELEQLVCTQLGLKPAPVSTQILQRDHHAQLITTFGIIGGSLEKMATEIRGLQKTECHEVLEPFGSQQKGSSAMPHKRNPILCERVTGLSRVLRGYVLTAMENQALWHERDISHSSAERIIISDAATALDYMLFIMTRVFTGMQVNTDRMRENMAQSYYSFYSQNVLLKLIDSGMTREDAYRIVQKNALDAYKERVNFDIKIKSDTAVSSRLSDDELDALFSLHTYRTHVDTIYTRVYSD